MYYFESFALTQVLNERNIQALPWLDSNQHITLQPSWITPLYLLATEDEQSDPSMSVVPVIVSCLGKFSYTVTAL